MLPVLREGRELGFLGPGTPEPHLAHALAFGRIVLRASETDAGGAAAGGVTAGGAAVGGVTSDAPPAASLHPHAHPARVLDLGSGGGLPGLVLAALWPWATVVLLDAQHRRTVFLCEAVRRLGLHTRVQVVNGRAEVLGRDETLRASFDSVVARAFGRPAVTAECAAPFLRVGGVLVVSEPPASPGTAGSPPVVEGSGTQTSARHTVHVRSDAADARADSPAPAPRSLEERWPRAGLAQLGMGPATPVRDEFGFVVIPQRSACSERFPRRVGLPGKRPLF